MPSLLQNIAISLSLLILAGFQPELRAQGTSPEQPRAEIRLNPKITLAASEQVKLGDIATIVDRNPIRRAKLASLDLIAFDATKDVTIERSFIDIRIMLAGFESEQIQILGPEKILLQTPPATVMTDLVVEQAALESISQQYSIPVEEIRVRLVSPFMTTALPPGMELRHPRLEVMPTNQIPLGRVQLTIRILENDRVIAARMGSFEIARRQQVVVAASSLERLSIVKAEHLREEMRFVDTPTDRLTVDQLIGRQVLIPFRPDDALTLRHVGQPVAQEGPILIQARDAVRLIARKGRLTVTVPVAEAMQPGREGQLIRVRNIQSNQIVTGVVAGKGEVHVVLP
ncbi:flagellar basal body P-ring formation chaperone FlgA [Planctomicrobium sp. SH668]|uniref:flagellar basal body P-ring formation chaperone FlgA n=1 Tax=Planctomicrobium sp. SH668 TaxID=3448126 RepID=UPI003F5BCAD1